MAVDTNSIKKPTNARGRRSRLAVLEAATQLFAERGYEGTTIADIASTAGTTKPGVLYHFPDKEALWRACVEELWGQVEAFYQQNWPRNLGPSRELIERALTLFVEAGLRWPAYIRIPFIEGATPSWRLEWLVDRHFANHVRTTDRILRSCQRRGVIPAGDPAHYQAIMTSPINVYLAQPAAWNRSLERRLDDRSSLLEFISIALNLTFRSERMDK